MQKGQLSILVLVGIVAICGIILFSPIPYYVGKDKVVCLLDTCPKHGWNLGSSLWQRISNSFQKSTSKPDIDSFIKDDESLKSRYPQPSAGETANWNTYSDAEYGFEISYPSNYQLERRGGGAIGLYKKPGTGIFDILIDIWDSQSEYEKQFINIDNLTVKKVKDKYITITSNTDKPEVLSIINTFKF